MTDSRKRQRPSAVGSSPRGARRVIGTAAALLLLLTIMRAPARLTVSAFGSKPNQLSHTPLPRDASLPFFGRPATATRLRQSSSNRGEPTPTTTRSDARTAASSSRSSSNTTTAARRLCFYQSPAHKNHWRPRVDLADLTVGQELNGAVVVQELLDGRTGPKLFLEVGVGRYCGAAKADDRRTTQPSALNDDPAPPWGDWHMVRAMLRVGTKFGKGSVARKRAARLRKKDHFQVYVSAVRPASGQLEVCLTRDEALAARSRKRPVRDLRVGHEYTGVVVRVEDYGVLVDVGAVRPGLLPLRRVADLMGHYIPQAAGLVKAGLERGARIKVQVTPTNTTEGSSSSSSKKKFALDFTDAVKEEAAVERARRAAVKAARIEARSSPPAVVVAATAVDPSAAAAADVSASASASELSEEEALAWAAFASNPSAPSSEIAASHEDEDNEEDYDEDDYDEDREIEDALGLGSY